MTTPSERRGRGRLCPYCGFARLVDDRCPVCEKSPPKLRRPADTAGPFAAKLYELMNAKGYDATRLEERSGIPFESIKSYLRGTRPRTPTLQKIAAALGVSPNAFGPSFADELKRLMRERGMSFGRLVDLCAMSPNELQRTVDGEALPLLKILRPIAEAIGVPLNTFAKCRDVKLLRPRADLAQRRTAGGKRFADKLNEVMREKGVTVEQLAARTGILAWHITKYTTGEQWPHNATIGKLAAALGVPPEKLQVERPVYLPGSGPGRRKEK